MRIGELFSSDDRQVKERAMETFLEKVSDLKPYKYNAKKHDQTQINNVAESIKQFGFVQPIVIDKNNEIVIGHCRWEASKKLGLEEVPCVLVDNLTDKQVKKLRIVDNKSNESDWDMDLLEIDIDDLDFSDFDFDFGLDVEEEEEQEKTIEPEVPFTEVLGEENNYIVLQFKTDIAWLQAQTIFNIQPVKALSTRKDGKITKKMERIGVGRVLDGEEVMQKLMGEKE